jgi:competence protein ComEC
MLLVMPARPPPGAARLLVLDVGQGTAALVETASHALVYDTGPRYSETSDAGSRVLAPVLRARGVRTLDGVVVSHQDADHSGGAQSLLAVVPATKLWSSLPATHPLLQEAQPAAQVVRCLAGMAWTWDGVRFEMLHPPAAIYADEQARTNDRSCVLRVVAGGATALLTGDIEARSEALLLQSAAADALHADVLLVPHHGSRTSSTTAFIAAVAPVHAVITAGYRNRFGHPRADVLARYRAGGASVIRTDEAGAVVVELGAQREMDAVAVRGWRAAHRRYWHDVPAPQPM